LLLIASVAAFILWGPIFPFESSKILYNPEGIIYKALTSNMVIPILVSSDRPIIANNRPSKKWVNKREGPKTVPMKQSRGLRLNLTDN
jgi:hypothetical protein